MRPNVRPLGPLLLAAAVILLGGCAAMTRFEAATPGTRLHVHGFAEDHLPRQERLGSKATGQHLFKATAPDGETLFGILPLRVNGGKMAMSILFFAPALFAGGFRDVFPYYEFDPQAGVIRYKTSADDEWRTYVPTRAEAERARAVLQ